jgi:hypothetical protein
MALIHDIQTALLDENASVGPMLLKLRFLAAKLDTDILEEWVQHEAEGYPDGVDVPEYRQAKITYTGSFADIAKQISNVSIPSGLVASIAGDHWVNYQIRDGLPLIESQIAAAKDGSHFGIDSSNLKVLLQDKIYQGMAILEINSKIDIGAFARVQHAVRAKTLDFTLKLEKHVPSVAEIEVGTTPVKMSPDEQKNVESLTQNIFYDVQGDVTNIHSSGDANSRVNLNSTDNSANVSD